MIDSNELKNEDITNETLTSHINNSWISELRIFLYCKQKILTADKTVALNTATFHMRGTFCAIPLKRTFIPSCFALPV
jgi:hypothetical protein